MKLIVYCYAVTYTIKDTSSYLIIKYSNIVKDLNELLTLVLILEIKFYSVMTFLRKRRQKQVCSCSICKERNAIISQELK